MVKILEHSIKGVFFGMLFLCCVRTSAQDLRSFTANGLYGFKRGNTVVIPPKYNYAGDFHSGRAAVLLDKKWGYIDPGGNLIIPNTLESAESFQDGYVRFHANGKMGLMDTMGRQVVPAICSGISKNDYGWWLYDGKKEGFYRADYRDYIAPEYVSLSFTAYFLLGRKVIGYDIYSEGGKPLAKNSKKYPELLNGNFYDSCCDVSVNDSVYIIDDKGNRLTQNYVGISRMNANVHLTTIDGTTRNFNTVYLLHLPDDEHTMLNNEDEELPNRFHLFYSLEYFWNDADYSNYYPQDNYATVSVNGLWSNINTDGTLFSTKYKKIEPFNAYELLYLEDNSVDVAKLCRRTKWVSGQQEIVVDTIQINHFPSAFVQYEVVANPEFDPDLNFNVEPEIMAPISVALIEVGDNAGKFAWFDLTQQRLITDYSEEHVFYAAEIYSGPAYLFRNDAGKIAYSYKGKTSAYEFDTYEEVYGTGVILHRADESTVVLNCERDTVLMLSSEYAVRSSDRVYRMVTGVSEPVLTDEGTYEPYTYKTTSNAFPFSFVTLETKSEPAKYGFLTRDMEIIPPQFDSIVGQFDVSYYEVPSEVVITVKDGKYGFVNLKTGHRVPNRYTEPFRFEFNSDWNVVFTPADDEPYYLNDNGKTFISLNDYYVSDKKKPKDVKELLTVSAFTGDSQPEVVMLLPVRKLEFLKGTPYLLAENKEKKRGLLSITGDTLLPFEYQDIIFHEDQFGNGGSKIFLELTTETGKGLWCDLLNRSIPCIYDEITFFRSASGYDEGYIARKGTQNDIYLFGLLPMGKDFDAIGWSETRAFTYLIYQKDSLLGVTDFGSFWPADIRNMSPRYEFIVDNSGYIKTDYGYESYYLSDPFILDFMDEPEFYHTDLLYFPKWTGSGLAVIRKSDNKIVLQTKSRCMSRTENGVEYLEDGKTKHFALTK